jgi:ribosome-binding protein aMBF1 (putative translation factor)
VTLAKIEAGEEVKRAKVFTADSVRAIQDYRRAQTKTQKELDQLCSFPAGTINGFESRKSGPTQRQLQELSRLLKQDLTLE